MKKLIYNGKWYNFISSGFDSVTLRLFKKSWHLKVRRTSIKKYKKAFPSFQLYRIEGIRSRRYKV